MGSYRRGAETSGDVDFLITRDDSDGLNHAGVIRKLVQKLTMRGIITHEVCPFSPSPFLPPFFHTILYGSRRRQKLTYY